MACTVFMVFLVYIRFLQENFTHIKLLLIHLKKLEAKCHSFEKSIVSLSWYCGLELFVKKEESNVFSISYVRRLEYLLLFHRGRVVSFIWERSTLFELNLNLNSMIREIYLNIHWIYLFFCYEGACFVCIRSLLIYIWYFVSFDMCYYFLTYWYEIIYLWGRVNFLKWTLDMRFIY